MFEFIVLDESGKNTLGNLRHGKSFFVNGKIQKGVGFGDGIHEPMNCGPQFLTHITT
jgi:hypothetical protein